MKAKKFNTIEEFDYKPGSYLVTGEDSVLMTLPCGHNFHPTKGHWKKSNIEDETKITLEPSIFCSPQVPCWHGFLRNGEFVKA